MTPPMSEQARNFYAFKGALTLAEMCLMYCAQPGELEKLKAWGKARAAETPPDDAKQVAELLESLDGLNGGILAQAAVRLVQMGDAGDMANLMFGWGFRDDAGV